MTTENDFKKIIGDIDICIQFKMLEVEVPVMIQKPLLLKKQPNHNKLLMLIYPPKSFVTGS
jgi:hypothetical protein